MKHLTLFALFLAAMLLMPASRARAEELNLFAWSEYVPTTVLEGFTKETGIKVNYETYASNEEMLSKLLSGATKYDLIQPSEYIIEALIKDKKLAELDHAKITNIKNIDPLYANLKYDPGMKYSVPWMSGSVGIVVNTDKVKDEVKGYKDLFSGKYTNRIVIPEDGREVVSWILATQGKDINVINEDVLKDVKPVMLGWLKQVRLYDSDNPKAALLNGDVDLGIVWSGEAATLYKENPKFKFVLPVEGAHRFVDSLAIPANAPNKEAATKFINYILRPEVSKQISEEFPYTNPNTEARKLLTEEELKNPASYPPGEHTMEIFRDIGNSAELVDALYTSVKAK